MAYRNLMIASSAHIKIKNEQLIINTDKDYSIPIEDINSLLIESRQATITMASLSALAQKGVTVFLCDEKHTPCAVMMPFAQHSRNVCMLKLQENLSQPLQKQLWQQIVKAKINNQGKCLELLNKAAEAKQLYALSKNVLSGDTNNTEATAARFYFKNLFSTDFIRSDDTDIRNSFLNYGYAILRGHIARLITSYGFIPMLGIHHRSEVNSYNLADDFIEPFRPIVDLYVARITNFTALNTQHKASLYNLLNMDVDSGGQTHSVSYAAERTIQSFSRCCQKTSKELLLPKLLELRQHTYE